MHALGGLTDDVEYYYDTVHLHGHGQACGAFHKLFAKSQQVCAPVVLSSQCIAIRSFSSIESTIINYAVMLIYLRICDAVAPGRGTVLLFGAFD